MNLPTSIVRASMSNALLGELADQSLRALLPSAFASKPHHSRSASYAFIPTTQIIESLGSAGFYPVEGRQTMRGKNVGYTRHMIRFRRTSEIVELRDAVPELLFLNSHDGTTAYQLRVGLYRTICTNGLIVSQGSFPHFRVAHRGDVVAGIVRAALEISEHFSVLASAVGRMEKTRLDPRARLELAAEAMALRFRAGSSSSADPASLLEARRPEDRGDDLWHTFNVIQENLLQGGIPQFIGTHRHGRTRRITGISADVRLNAGLWDLALSRTT